MMRLIDADTLERMGYVLTRTYKQDKKTMVYETKKLSDVPSVEPHWIPCSDGLPKKDDRYQVTRYDYVTNTEFIDILWYEKNLWWDRHSTGDYAVTAWMPLPEPYGGESE